MVHLPLRRSFAALGEGEIRDSCLHPSIMRDDRHGVYNIKYHTVESSVIPSDDMMCRVVVGEEQLLLVTPARETFLVAVHLKGRRLCGLCSREIRIRARNLPVSKL